MKKKIDVASANKNIEIQSISIKLENLSKAKKLDFAKANFSKTNFFIFKAKKTFVYL